MIFARVCVREREKEKKARACVCERERERAHARLLSVSLTSWAAVLSVEGEGHDKVRKLVA